MKLKVKVKGPNLCYIFEKHVKILDCNIFVPKSQIYNLFRREKPNLRHFCHNLSQNVKKRNGRKFLVPIYATQKSHRLCHVLYFWQPWDSRISNMTFLCIKCQIHKYSNTLHLQIDRESSRSIERHFHFLISIHYHNICHIIHINHVKTGWWWTSWVSRISSFPPLAPTVLWILPGLLKVTFRVWADWFMSVSEQCLDLPCNLQSFRETPL